MRSERRLAAAVAEARTRSETGRDEIERLLGGPPSAAAQLALLRLLHWFVSPILGAQAIPGAFTLCAGTRLRRRYGQCQHFRDGRPARISIRCTADADPSRWRARGAITLTLLHELAHLRHCDHSRRFWLLLRTLVDLAAEAGIYDAATDDPTERACGDGKLAGSAAQLVAHAALTRRRERTESNRRALASLRVGARARIMLPRGHLASAVVLVVGKLRTRLLVEAPDGHIYRVSAALLEPMDQSSDAEVLDRG